MRQHKKPVDNPRAAWAACPSRLSRPYCWQKLFGVVFAIAIACFLILVLPEDAASQRVDILEIKTIKNDVRSQFSLSSRDLVRIEPIIDQESRKLIKMYARFSGDEPEYSSRVWDQIIEDRSNFEVNMGFGLSRKQKDALRSARAQMEKKVLGFLVDEYTSLLAQLLELSQFQSNDVVYLFEVECEKKRRLVDERLGDVRHLQIAIEKVSVATEASLKQILTADQWREFCKMKEGDALIA